MKNHDLYYMVCVPVYVAAAVMLILALFFLFTGKIRFDAPADYESQNAILRHQCDSLQSVVSRLQNVTNLHLATIDSLQTLLIQNTHQINENSITHEKEIVRIDHMPADSLFCFFTEYIENN